MILDVAQLAVKHFEKMFDASILLYGVTMKVFRPIPDEGAPTIEDLYDERQYPDVPTAIGKALIGQPTIGVSADEYVSLSDKLDEDMTVFTRTLLYERDMITLELPKLGTDLIRDLDLEVIAPSGDYALTVNPFRYTCRVR